MAPPSPRTILIAGPTASGKSALALRMARELDGIVVNADSMQVYRELAIITARPTAADEAFAPHRLYGHVSARDPYSVGRWIEDLTEVVAEASACRRPLIVVGGTGLYFKAMLEGLSPIPAIDPELRRRRRDQAVQVGAGALHEELSRRDPETAARLKPSDTQRIVRALEVLDQTGIPLVQWQRLPGRPVTAVDDTDRFVVARPRDELYARARVRLEQMLAAGALDEAARFAELGIDPAAPATRAIGVRPFMALAAGQIGRTEALDIATTETHKYIKRQLTWLKRQMISWNFVQ